MGFVDELADSLVLSACLSRLRSVFGSYELIAHWAYGEYHHDLVFRLAPSAPLPGSYLVVSANCNGGIKEVLCFAEPPSRSALWHWRCPERPEFSGALPAVLDQARTLHYVEPIELLDASETDPHSVRISAFAPGAATR